MRTRNGWLALLLTAGMTLAPSAAWGQRFVHGESPGPEDPATYLPLYHDRPEEGGFYCAAEFLYWRQTNPLRNQLLAVRGFVDVDGSVQDAINLLNGANLAPNTPGFHFGSGLPALNVDQASGPGSYAPGLAFTAGWKFGNGVAVEFTWRHLEQVRYNASAGPIPPNLWPGFVLADTYLFSPVFNFPPEYAGSPQKVVVNGFVQGASSNGFIVHGAAYGIWNGASDMSISFVQRHEQFDLIGRCPIYQGDCCRVYGLTGARHVQIWERFEWRAQTSREDFIVVGAQDTDVQQYGIQQLQFGVPTAVNFTTASGIPLQRAGARGGLEDLAIYSNKIANRLYGAVVGCGSEWYLGHGFAFSLDLRGALHLDFAKERFKYERGDRFISHKRSRSEFTLVPELDAFANIWWYPIEGVQIRVGYDFMCYFNTVSSRQPVSFDYGTLDPPVDKHTFRMFDGFHIGIGLIF